jgi:hypothetical protein
MHRPSPGIKALNEILCISKEHVLRNDNTVAHNNRFYQVLERTTAKKVEVRDYVDGQVAIIGRDNKHLRYEVINKRPVIKKAQKRLKRPMHIPKRYRVKWLLGNWGCRPRFKS